MGWLAKLFGKEESKEETAPHSGLHHPASVPASQTVKEESSKDTYDHSSHSGHSGHSGCCCG